MIAAPASLDRLVSPYTGVVDMVLRSMAQLDDLRLPRVSATGKAWFRRAENETRLLGFRPGEDRNDINNPTLAGGAAPGWSHARASALGEAAERYSATYIPVEQLVYSTARELGDRALQPERAAQFADRQHARPGFPFRRFDLDTPLRWVEGVRLPDFEPILVPAQFVYLSQSIFRFEPVEQPLLHVTSNGLAAGPTEADAALAALYELLERDALMLAWLHRISPPRLRWDGAREFEAFERRFLAPTGHRYATLDLSEFHGVPTVVALVRGPVRGTEVLTCGASAAPSLFRAWRKALTEAFFARTWVKNCCDPDALSEYEFASDFSDVRTFFDHIAFFARPDRADCASFLDSSPVRRHVSTTPDVEDDEPLSALRRLSSGLAARGIDTYVVDITSPDLRDAGIRVVRVVAPGLCQLNADHRTRFLGTDRVRTAAAGLGLGPVRDIDELNPFPHPMA